MNNVLGTEAFLDRFAFYSVVLDKRKLILRWKEKGRKRLKGGETCTCFLLNLFSLPQTKKIMPDRFVLCLAYTAIVRVQ